MQRTMRFQRMVQDLDSLMGVLPMRCNAGLSVSRGPVVGESDSHASTSIGWIKTSWACRYS